jgi:hypothetical protein
MFDLQILARVNPANSGTPGPYGFLWQCHLRADLIGARCLSGCLVADMPVLCGTHTSDGLKGITFGAVAQFAALPRH